MKKLNTLAVFAALSLATSLSFADTVVTKDGSKLIGKIKQINGANVVLTTDAAGDVTIKDANIVSLATDAPINLRLADGTVALGTANMRAPGMLVINTARGPVSAGMEKVTQTWAADAKDPELVKRERHWSFEAGLDVTGRTGNTEQFGTSVSFSALLKSSFDALKLYTGYDYGRQSQLQSGNVIIRTKSADQGRVGADYRNNFSGRFSWYATDELGFNRIKSMSLYNNASAGFGYDIVKASAETLTVRVGLAHIYQRYSNSPPGTPSSLSTLALDTGLFHDLKMKTWSMHNEIRYQPSVTDSNTYIIKHESHIEFPLANPNWKFQVGMANNYQNPLPPDPLVTERLDTTYFAKLILDW